MKKRRRDSDATQFARRQRSTANEFAHDVWQMVRNRRCCGEKFRREYPIPPYTVDFCCVALKLVIEVDGKGHFTEEGLQRDKARDEYLRRLGFKVVRVPGYEVVRNPMAVRKKIVEAITDSDNGDAPHPRPLSPEP